MNWGKLLLQILCVFCFLSCQESEKERITRLVKEWNGKEIKFPNNIVFTIQGRDTVDFDCWKSTFKIVTYVDSIGCVSCNMQLDVWKWFIEELNSISDKNIPVMFFIHPEEKSYIQDLLRDKKFNYPVCIDLKNEFGSLNELPNHIMFQTFLLNSENKVINIGNPVHNLNIWELYINTIKGDC